MSKITACPECGEPIEASVKVYLDDVEFDTDDLGLPIVTSSRDSSKHIGVEVEYYCSNDHNVEAKLIETFGNKLPRLISLDGGEYST